MTSKLIAFIPVRGGSKSIPLKNIKSFCEKPLVYWNIEALEQITEVDEIVIATDSDEIKQVVLAFGFSKVSIYDRDPFNAKDTSSTESVMLEYINKSGLSDSDMFLLVQATSPLTTVNDFQNAIKEFYMSKKDSLLTGVRTKNFFWNSNGTTINYDYMKRPRRQDFEGLIQENGAFYINSVGNIRKYRNRLSGSIHVYEMPEYTAFEIDEPDDWIICESLMYRHILSKKNSKKDIKLFLTDVDGVLTDAGMYYTENGDELKKFNTLDGKGFELLRNSGIKLGIITSEDTKIVEKRAQKLKVDYLYQGAKNKLSIAGEICQKEGITFDNVAYIGDDINDTELLKKVGLAATPANGVKQNKEIPGIIKLQKQGGSGAVREFVDMILAKNSMKEIL